jgi:hypothetical protein
MKLFHVLTFLIHSARTFGQGSKLQSRILELTEEEEKKRSYNQWPKSCHFGAQRLFVLNLCFPWRPFAN